MEFEHHQKPVMLGPLFVQQALTDIPLFGEKKADVDGIIHKALQPHYAVPQDFTEDTVATQHDLPESFSKGSSTAQKLQGLRDSSRRTLRLSRSQTDYGGQPQGALEELAPSTDDTTTGRTEPPSNRQLHEKLLSQNIDARGLHKEAQIVLDHIPLLRANNSYLFDPAVNRDVLADDPWLRDLWDWIGGMFFQLALRL